MKQLIWNKITADIWQQQNTGVKLFSFVEEAHPRDKGGREGKVKKQSKKLRRCLRITAE